MAHSHYVVDLYYATDGKPDQLRREVLRIESATDAEATEEAIRMSGWRHPVRFDVRAITNSVRTGDRLVHSSVAVSEAEDAGEPAAAQPDQQESAP